MHRYLASVHHTSLLVSASLYLLVAIATGGLFRFGLLNQFAVTLTGVTVGYDAFAEFIMHRLPRWPGSSTVMEVGILMSLLNIICISLQVYNNLAV